MNEETQKFLESLTEEDIKRIKSALKTYVVVETLSWWIKCLALSGLALLVSLSQFTDAARAIKEWFK